MGRNTRAFIDKKKATTYQLIYHSTGGEDEGSGRVFQRISGTPDPASDLSDLPSTSGQQQQQSESSHPLDWLRAEQQPAEALPQERRRELIELGFTDDGYDYTRHLVTLGSGRAELPIASTPAPPASGDLIGLKAKPKSQPEPVFQPPPEDERVLNAVQLTVHAEAKDDDDALTGAAGVTAFSKTVKHEVTGATKKELLDLRAAMEAIDEDGFEVPQAWDPAEGEGDMLDDFILEATQVDDTEADSRQALRDSDIEEEEEYDEFSSGAGSDGCVSESQSQMQDMVQGWGGRLGSTTSSYWRAERHDRGDNLSVIDERFEALALEYDDDDIGDLEGREPVAAGGGVELSAHQPVYDEYMATRNFRGLERSFIADALRPAEPGDDVIARQVALKAAVAMAEADEEEGADDEVEGVHYPFGPAHRDLDDCQSVLSRASNLYNHPRKLSSEGGTSVFSPARLGRGQEPIKLSRKTGLPLGVLGRSTAGVAAEEDDEEVDVPVVDTSIGRKGETKEQKRARKAAGKADKREARASKKEMKTLFKQQDAQHQRRQAHSAHGTVVRPLA